MAVSAAKRFYLRQGLLLEILYMLDGERVYIARYATDFASKPWPGGDFMCCMVRKSFSWNKSQSKPALKAENILGQQSGQVETGSTTL